jgi:hypothetical protein
MSLMGLGISLLLTYLIIVRCEHRTRVDEQEVLSLVCNAKCQDQFIERAKAFMAKLTL